MHNAITTTNVALRGVLEAGIVAACAYWGYIVAPTMPLRVLLAVLAPLLAFGFWGAVDFRFAGRRAEPLRLAQELLVTLLASAALHSTGHDVFAGLLLLASLVHHALIYLNGQRLLKPRTT